MQTNDKENRQGKRTGRTLYGKDTHMGGSDFAGKTYLVVGVANRKSVAYFIAKTLLAEGATVLCSVRDDSMRDTVAGILPEAEVHVCNVETEGAVETLAAQIGAAHPVLHGMVHSIAYANYSEGIRPFHETVKKDFLQAIDISCFSLIALANACQPLFDPHASVVTISISSTRTASESYGYMGPVKAALDASVVFLAKSFSAFSEVRFNSVNAGPLKTSASAGIPGYVDSYLYAGQLTLRKRNVTTQEVADTAVFLLSPKSAGINAQPIIVDAGMGVNAFDRDVIHKATREL